MKIYLKKNFLQEISKGEQELLITDEQQEEIERIEGMIKHNIRFCTLVTGYRGTGKSSFVHYMLKKYIQNNDYKTEEDHLIISYNATKYKNYKTFMRRFIRELYLKMKEHGLASNQLKKMYVQTFFDVKETYQNDILRLDNNLKEKEKQQVFHRETNIKGMLLEILKMSVCFVPVEFVANSIGKCGEGLAVIMVCLLIYILINSITMIKKDSWKSKKEKKIGIKNTEEQNKFAETLYDKEIAEYYIFDELDKISKNKVNLIFVLDELDKVETKELDKIFHDLKSLFLSCSCNFILIAGKNMEKYLLNAQKDIDNIAKTIFTNKIYISLSTVQDMMDFAMMFLDSSKLRKNEVQFYFEQKIFIAEGIKRAFINSILSDLRWDDKNRPYIEAAENLDIKESEALFNVLKNMETVICQENTGPKRDELLMDTYQWINKIKEKQHELFKKEDIIEETIDEKSIYSNEAEKMNLVQTLFEFMCKEGLLYKNGTFYEWRFEISIKNVSNKMNNGEISKSNLEYVEIFQKQWEEIGNIICLFSKYNGICENNIGLVPDEYKRLLEIMVGKEQLAILRLSESLLFFQKVYKNGIENVDIENIKQYTRNIGMKKAELLEMLMYFTIFHKQKRKDINGGEGHRWRFDIIYQKDKKKVRFVEIKYYKDYRNMLHSDKFFELRGRVDEYIDRHQIRDWKLQIVLFTDFATEVELKKFNDRAQNMLGKLYEKDDMKLILVPLNNYKMFSEQIDSVLKGIYS